MNDLVVPGTLTVCPAQDPRYAREQRTALDLLEGSPAPFGDRVLVERKTEQVLPQTATGVYLFGDHNYSYFYWKLSELEGELEPGAVLIHFDAHHDLFSRGRDLEHPGQTAIGVPPEVNCLDPDDIGQGQIDIQQLAYYALGRLSIGNFITPALLDGTVSECYWVLPEEARPGTEDYRLYWQTNDRADFLIGPRRDVECWLGSYELHGQQYIFFDDRLPPWGLEVHDLKTVMIHKVYLDQLPALPPERPVILDIDADYFALTGWENRFFPAFWPSINQVEGQVASTFTSLINKNIHPAIVTFCRSPEYCPTALVTNIENKIKAVMPHYLSRFFFEQGPVSYSLNTVRLAQCLLGFIQQNKTFYGHHDLVKPDPEEACRFNEGMVSLDLIYVDESRYKEIDEDPELRQGERSKENHIWHRLVPPAKFESTVKIETRRGDYAFFISRASAYGLTGLVKLLEELTALQNDPQTTRDQIQPVFRAAEDLLEPISSYLK